MQFFILTTPLKIFKPRQLLWMNPSFSRCWKGQLIKILLKFLSTRSQEGLLVNKNKILSLFVLGTPLYRQYFSIWHNLFLVMFPFRFLLQKLMLKIETVLYLPFIHIVLNGFVCKGFGLQLCIYIFISL